MLAAVINYDICDSVKVSISSIYLFQKGNAYSGMLLSTRASGELARRKHLNGTAQ